MSVTPIPNPKSKPKPSIFPIKLPTPLANLLAALSNLESLTRPATPASITRYRSLPSHTQTPSQMLGRLTPGCEGTKGVFPRCNLACKPCYHSADANAVRVDGMHTITNIAQQMQLLRTTRGPTAHCQLIGGEVSLLSPTDHALALETMRFFGRIPMSFTHGDFDYDYLKRLALNEHGKPRFERLDFAVHFDMGMRGRRLLPRVQHEHQLTPFRRRFVHMFQRLRREHNVRYYLAHNMTIQSENLPQLAETVRELRTMGFRLLSFQPAALQGAEHRRVANLRAEGDDDGESVWKQIERGMGIRLPYSLFQMGDVRCNRMCVCGIVNARDEASKAHIFVLFDDECDADHHVRDLIVRELGNIVLPSQLLVAKIARVFLRKPWLLVDAARWVMRLVRRTGGLWTVLRGGVQWVTIVMHRFMDAEDVKKAWALMETGVEADDDRVKEAGVRIRETMDRLAACSYGMAQPENGRVVPACVQHSVYDEDENVQLAKLLPLGDASRPGTDASLDWKT